MFYRALGAALLLRSAAGFALGVAPPRAVRRTRAPPRPATRDGLCMREGLEQGNFWRSRQGEILRGVISWAAFTLGPPAVGGAMVNLGAANAAVRAGVAEAGMLHRSKRFTKRTVGEKLANVPVFMVVNHDGQPYLTPSNERQQGVFFTCVDDAQQMLNEMLQQPHYRGDCRLMILSLERAYNMARAGPRPTGHTNSEGRPETFEYVFHPSESGRLKATDLGLGGAVKDVAVPVYYADGLLVSRDGALVRPFFMDAQDLFDAWFKARRSNPSMPRSPNVRVFSLPEVALRMDEAGGKGEYADFAFFPSTAATKYVAEVKSQTGTKARLPSLRTYEY